MFFRCVKRDLDTHMSIGCQWDSHGSPHGSPENHPPSHPSQHEPRLCGVRDLFLAGFAAGGAELLLRLRNALSKRKPRAERDSKHGGITCKMWGFLIGNMREHEALLFQIDKPLDWRDKPTLILPFVVLLGT